MKDFTQAWGWKDTSQPTKARPQGAAAQPQLLFWILKAQITQKIITSIKKWGKKKYIKKKKSTNLTFI